jgi:hypothetical protein
MIQMSHFNPPKIMAFGRHQLKAALRRKPIPNFLASMSVSVAMLKINPLMLRLSQGPFRHQSLTRGHRHVLL